MEIKWLEDFVTLAETSSFSRAAEARNVTQSAFSRRIKQLETWVGATLISRATMPAELTPAGRNFLPVARETIRTFYTVRETLRPASEHGLVHFAALHTLTVTFFPQWLAQLQREGGEIGTSILPDRGGIEANLAFLSDGEADFFLTYAHKEVPFHLDHELFEFLTIGTDRLIPLAAPHVRSGNGVLAGRDLLDRALAEKLTIPYLSYGYSSFFGVALGKLLARQPGFRQRIIHQNTISAGLKIMALNGAGICWLPESLVEQELASGTLVPITQSAGWSLELDIRLYRSVGNRKRNAEILWSAAQRIASRAS
ncbi:LysR family transcriptional regulator [Mesorhizobium sp. BAC0120]|uniref:LysR family transcriptional regulator n=1 Tax=Mesorhizobium sp. BAC0120 TaxID=3090670 RepID=UPI00298C8A5E|nr:LysR family transcriptional regulator [Mesorhizobium sp. BAC0120]MDW6025761.1 LysR family transcriptional regulator [Mesorhizobium sp. BAC0120]